MSAKQIIVSALVIVGAGIASFSAGRFSAPEIIQNRDVERIVYRDLSVEDITRGYMFAKTVDRIVYRNVVTTVTDAGTIIVDRSVEHEGGNIASGVTETKHTAQNVETAAEKIVERTITLRPDWRIGVLAGGSLRPPLVPLAGPLVLGAQVDRRIVGGLSVGAWVNTIGAPGVAVTLEF